MSTNEYTFAGDPETIHCAILDNLEQCGLYNDDIDLISIVTNKIKGELVRITDGYATGFKTSSCVIGDTLHKKVMNSLFNRSAHEP